MDGVITNTMPYHFKAWKEVLLNIGIKASCFDVYKREGQDGLSTLRTLFQEKGLKFDLRQAQDILRRKEELFKRIVRIKFVPGSRSFVRNLHKHGFLLGLVTGTSRHEMERILPRDLRDLFCVTVTGDEVKKSKPNPEPFLKAFGKLVLAKKDVVVIENAPFGIEAAKKAGLRCIALETSLPRYYLKGADMVFKSFTQLKKAVCEL